MFFGPDMSQVIRRCNSLKLIEIIFSEIHAGYFPHRLFYTESKGVEEIYNFIDKFNYAKDCFFFFFVMSKSKVRDVLVKSSFRLIFNILKAIY